MTLLALASIVFRCAAQLQQTPDPDPTSTPIDVSAAGSKPADPARRAKEEETPEPQPPSANLHAEWTIGWRAVHVGGNRAQYDEDRNLDSGPVLRELLFEGQPLDSDWRSFSLHARGIGDPDSSLRAELSGERTRAVAKLDRTRFEAASDSDLHVLSLERELGSLRIEQSSPGNEHGTGSLELSYAHRDTIQVGTRSVDFSFVPGFPVRTDERTVGAHGNTELELEGWEVELEGGFEHLASSDERHFAAPSPSNPASLQTEDFEADLLGLALRGEVRAARELDSGRVRVDFGAELAQEDLDGDLHSYETGILYHPMFPFTRDTRADADVEGREAALDAGVRCEVSEDLALTARLSRIREDENGNLRRTVILDEFMGPPTTSHFADRTEYGSRLDLLEVGAEIALAEHAELDLSLEAGREDLHVLETVLGTPLRRFDGTEDRFGGEALLELEPREGLTLSLAAGAEVAPTERSLEGSNFRFGDDRGLFASIRARWRPHPRCSLFASAKRQESNREAFRAEADSTALSLGASAELAQGWNASSSLLLREFDLASPTLDLFAVPGPLLLPGSAEFHGEQAVLSCALSARLHSRFEPRLAWSAGAGGGDASFRYGSLLADMPFQIAPASWLGAELELLGLDAREGTNAQDFDSAAFLLYLRTGF